MVGNATCRIPSSKFGVASSTQFWVTGNVVVLEKSLEVGGFEYTECSPNSRQGSQETQRDERPHHCKFSKFCKQMDMLLVTVIQEQIYPAEYSLTQQTFVCTYYYDKDTMVDTRNAMMRQKGGDSH